MEMRYRNCLFLDKGQVDGSLSHASKTLVKVWNEVNNMYPIKEQPVDYEPYIIGTLFIVSLILVVGSMFSIALM